jgi:hypothetical protein
MAKYFQVVGNVNGICALKEVPESSARIQIIMSEVDGVEVFKDIATDRHYVTELQYAKMAAIGRDRASERASASYQSSETYRVIYLGAEGVGEDKAQYLIPIEILFLWLFVDNPQKAIVIGTDAVTEALKFPF